MDTESSARGRHFHFSGAPELVGTADSALHLQVHAHLPRGRSDFIARNGKGVAADDAPKAADPLSYVLVLRTVHEAAQIHPPGLA